MQLAWFHITCIVFTRGARDEPAVQASTLVPNADSLIANWQYGRKKITRTGYQAATLWHCKVIGVHTCSHTIYEDKIPCICDIDVYKWIAGLILVFAVIATLILLTMIGFVQNATSEVQADPEGDPKKAMANKLTEAKRHGHLRRLRVSGPLMIVGFSLISGGISITSMYLTTIAVSYLSVPLTVLGYVAFVAALIPTDIKTIVMVAWGASSVLFFLGFHDGQKCYDTATTNIHYYHGKQGYKYYIIFYEGSLCVLHIILAFYILGLLYSRPKGTVLRRLWTVAGIKVAYGASFSAFGILVAQAYGRKYTPLEWSFYIWNILLSIIIGYMCLTPHLRHHVRDIIATNSTEAAAAGGVAHLISSQDPLDLLARAEATFTSVSADRLTQEDMSDNKPNPRLRALAVPAQMGNVDAFMSHSWHDDPEAKWKSLQSWRRHFKNMNDGKEPTLWIDKYCIDQNNINESLACLPIWLSACKKLVVFCGNTYLERLWCVVEVFVFTLMDIDNNDLEVHLIGDKESLIQIVRNFDIDHARCFTEADTAKLREVIDAGGSVLRGQLVKFVQENFAR